MPKKPSDTLRWCGARKGITKDRPLPESQDEGADNLVNASLIYALGAGLRVCVQGITENQLKSLIMAQIERWRHG